METALLIFLIVLAALTVALQVIALRKPAAAPVDLAPVQARLEALERALERAERGMREEIARNRQETGTQARSLREEVAGALAAMGGAQAEQFARLTAGTDQKLEAVRTVVDQRLRALQEDNAGKLDQMRRTVDEQLQGTLEKRLGDSFRVVSDRLEQVYRGLGEMQALATGVGDLKKVLTNVRTRGTWGEVQLGTLLAEVMAPEQYQQNVATTGTAERVEFAIKLPGADGGPPVWLPIDAKFPQEDYLRLVEASERGDAAEVEICSKQLEQRIAQCARDIREKYIAPPATTDFGVMYLPTESLYAEVLRRPGLVETLQRDWRITVTGPTTLAAFLNSLRMGFRTLAIQQRSSEVWELLAAVKTEFARYAHVLDRLKKKLQEASNTVDKGLTRTRAIERKLRDVEALPSGEAATLLPGPDIEEDEAAEANA